MEDTLDYLRLDFEKYSSYNAALNRYAASIETLENLICGLFMHIASTVYGQSDKFDCSRFASLVSFEFDEDSEWALPNAAEAANITSISVKGDKDSSELIKLINKALRDCTAIMNARVDELASDGSDRQTTSEDDKRTAAFIYVRDIYMICEKIIELSKK